MKLDPRHLMQVSAIVEAGGMTEGAALVGATQPALSRTVASLEARLRAPLFVRGRRPLEPTQLGRALAEQGAAIRMAVERAEKGVAGFLDGTAGSVRVGGTPFFMDALVTGMIAEFQIANPGVRIDQSYGYTADLVEQVRGGRLDLAICPIEMLDAQADVAFDQVLPGRNVVACRDGHPLLAAGALDPRALLDYPWIQPPPGSPLNADLHSTLLSLGAQRLPVVFSGGSLASVVNYLRASDGLSVLPHSVVFSLGREAPIAALPMRLDHPPRALGIVRPAGPGRLPPAERLAAHVKRRFADLRDEIRAHELRVLGPAAPAG
jgi:DNA-binding transcriptional LysR family regulator